jgi:hypothetical protein
MMINEWRIEKDMEGNDRDLFQGTVPVFSRKFSTKLN